MKNLNPKLIKKLKKKALIELTTGDLDQLDLRIPTQNQNLKQDSVPLLDANEFNIGFRHDQVSLVEAVRLKKELNELRRYSSSLNQLMWIFILGCLFIAIIKIANQKYIQYKLQGEATDLATLETFGSMAQLCTPFFGVMMDNFYPLRFRITPYLLFTEIIQIGCLLVIGLANVSKSVYLLLLAIYTCLSILSMAITQAVIAIKTKVDIEIKEKEKELEVLTEAAMKTLEPNEGIIASRDPSDSTQSSDAVAIGIYATFSIFTELFGGISPVFSGFLVDSMTNIQRVYLVAMIPNLVLLAFTLFIFRERRMSSVYPQNTKSVKQTFVLTYQVLKKPALLLPTLVMLLISVTPTMSQAIIFI